MKKSYKFIILILFFFLISGCVKKEIEDAVRNSENVQSEKKLNIENSFLAKYTAPAEQLDFLGRIGKLDALPEHVAGTREEEKYLNAATALKNSINSITEWICEVDKSAVFSEEEKIYRVFCFIDGAPTDILRSNIISFYSKTKYYKNDILKISGLVKLDINVLKNKWVMVTPQEDSASEGFTDIKVISNAK